MDQGLESSTHHLPPDRDRAQPFAADVSEVLTPRPSFLSETDLEPGKCYLHEYHGHICFDSFTADGKLKLHKFGDYGDHGSFSRNTLYTSLNPRSRCAPMGTVQEEELACLKAAEYGLSPKGMATTCAGHFMYYTFEFPFRGSGGVDPERAASSYTYKRFNGILKSIDPALELYDVAKEILKDHQRPHLDDVAQALCIKIFQETGLDVIRARLGREDNAWIKSAATNEVLNGWLWRAGVAVLGYNNPRRFSEVEPLASKHELTLGAYLPEWHTAHNLDEFSQALLSFKSAPSKGLATRILHNYIPQVSSFIGHHRNEIDGRDVVIVPIPGSRPDAQSGIVLAEALADALGCECADVISRARHRNGRRIRSQKEQGSWVDRLTTIGKAINLKREVPGKVAVLIDDITTSNATLTACRKALYEGGSDRQGAHLVLSIALAKTVSVSDRP